MNLLGIDIGGTKTSVCVGTDDGKILAAARIASGGYESVQHYENNLADLCAAVIQKAGVPQSSLVAAGISAPGPLSVARGVLIAPPNNPAWRDLPIVEMVQRRLGVPAHLNNDGNAAALAEFEFGRYRGTRDLVYLTFSTGMGGGIIAEGRLVQGVNDNGGEVGHQVLDPTGPVCGCGQRGCWEAYVGGRRVAERLREKIKTGRLATTMIEKAGSVEAITMKHLLAAATEGDPVAVAEWDAVMERLAQGIGGLIMVLNPRVILLGTIAIHAGEFALQPLREKLPKYCWPWPRQVCTVTTSTLGEGIGDYAALAVAVYALQQKA